jgi:hypothetical protein
MCFLILGHRLKGPMLYGPWLFVSEAEVTALVETYHSFLFIFWGRTGFWTRGFTLENFFFFVSTGVWTQALAHARQVLYHLIHFTSLRASHLKAGTLQLEPHLQSFLLWLFWRWGLSNYLPGLAILLISASHVGMQLCRISKDIFFF